LTEQFRQSDRAVDAEVDRRAPIPRAKIKGMLEALARDHVVRFNTGRTVEYLDCPTCEGTGKLAPVMKHSSTIVAERTCNRCGGEKVLLLVVGLAGGTSRYRLDDPGDVERAYKMALYGPAPKAQPPRAPAKPGDDDPPF
jgi:hypothetical protein